MDKNFKPPRLLLRKITQTAPTHTINYDSEEYDVTFSSFESVLVYIQKGLEGYTNLVREVVKLILKVQYPSGRRYPLIPFSFGNEKTLTNERKYFELGYISDSNIYIKISEALIRLSTSIEVNHAVIPELFPQTDIRDLYRGKIKVTDKDLLVIIGKKDQVYFDISTKPILKLKIKKHILFVEIDGDIINWVFKNYTPLFND